MLHNCAAVRIDGARGSKNFKVSRETKRSGSSASLIFKQVDYVTKKKPAAARAVPSAVYLYIYI